MTDVEAVAVQEKEEAQAGAAAPTASSQAPLPNLTQTLADVTEEIQKTQQAVDEATTSLEKTGEELETSKAELRQWQQKKAALERLQQEVAGVRENVAQRRQSAAEAHQAGQTFLQETHERLNRQVGEATRQQIEQVDGAGDPLRQQVATSQTEVGEAEAAVAEARRDATWHDARLQQVKSQLQQLPGEIQAAERQLENRRTAVQTAADGGRMPEAYLLLLDVQRALDDLEETAGEDRERQLLAELDGRWQKAYQAQTALAARQAALQQKQAALAEAQSALRAHDQERKQNILKASADDRSSG